MSQVNTELGRSSTASISLGETAVRTLAGVASGAISMNDLRGKSAVTFTPNGGTSSGSPTSLSDSKSYPNIASVTINCSQAATWNWTKLGDIGSYASINTGGTSTSITFYQNPNNFNYRSTTFTVNATAGGVTRYWTVTVSTSP